MRLTRGDLIGHRIVRVEARVAARAVDGWLDDSRTFFVLDNGLRFRLPCSDQEELSADREASVAPQRRRPLETLASVLRRSVRFERADGVTGAVIVDLLRCIQDDAPMGSVAMLLDNGNVLTENFLAPHGTGGAGLLVHSATEWRAAAPDELRPFWSV